MSCVEGQSRVSGTLEQLLSAPSAGVGVCGGGALWVNQSQTRRSNK